MILATGNPSIKQVNGKTTQVTPFCGTDSDTKFAQMGVGFMTADKGALWGLLMPRTVIQSWRAMRLLEHVPEIEGSTLCHCHGAVSRRGDEMHVALAELVGGMDKLKALVAEIMTMAPTSDELDRMLIQLSASGIDVACWELQAEIEAGTIALTPTIADLFRKDEAERAAYQAQDAEINAALPPEESFGWLLADLGITNLVRGNDEIYGWDWDVIPLGIVDRMIKRHFIPTDLPLGPFTLTQRVNNRHGQPTGARSPFFKDASGTTFTFTSVRYTNGTLHVTFQKTKGGTLPTIEATLPVKELRKEMKLSMWRQTKIRLGRRRPLPT